jgi:hypothetical protein
LSGVIADFFPRLKVTQSESAEGVRDQPHDHQRKERLSDFCDRKVNASDSEEGLMQPVPDLS